MKLSYEELACLLGFLRCYADDTGTGTSSPRQDEPILTVIESKLEAALTQLANPVCRHGRTEPHTYELWNESDSTDESYEICDCPGPTERRRNNG